MPTGPGKYDDLCTNVREQTEARAVILMVFDGTRGTGMSLQIDPNHASFIDRLPTILRATAFEIETHPDLVPKPDEPVDS